MTVTMNLLLCIAIFHVQVMHAFMSTGLINYLQTPCVITRSGKASRSELKR